LKHNISIEALSSLCRFLFVVDDIAGYVVGGGSGVV